MNITSVPAPRPNLRTRRRSASFSEYSLDSVPCNDRGALDGACSDGDDGSNRLRDRRWRKRCKQDGRVRPSPAPIGRWPQPRDFDLTPSSDCRACRRPRRMPARSRPTFILPPSELTSPPHPRSSSRPPARRSTSLLRPTARSTPSSTLAPPPPPRPAPPSPPPPKAPSTPTPRSPTHQLPLRPATALSPHAAAP